MKRHNYVVANESIPLIHTFFAFAHKQENSTLTYLFTFAHDNCGLHINPTPTLWVVKVFLHFFHPLNKKRKINQNTQEKQNTKPQISMAMLINSRI